MKKSNAKYVFVFLFFLGAWLRTVDVWRPFDGSSVSSWHGGDTASIARNFYREGMNLLYPRIDWRGNGPGYVEMEFPLFPWTAAALYRLAGIREEILRLLPFSFSLFGMWVFFRLAHRMIPAPGDVAAAVFFAIHPLLVAMARSIQPGSLMLAFYIVAVYAFLRWLDDRRPRHFVLACAATALAILLKATAAHIGFLFAALVLDRMGFRAVKDRTLWLFAVLSLTPGVLWYTHARGLWLVYGNSLGVSNEYHWVGWDFFTDPYFITGILGIELRFWSVTAFLLGAWGIWASRRSDLRNSTRVAMYWLGSAWAFYVIAARTSADEWASYYHIFSIAPMALLFGIGLTNAGTILRRVRKVSVIGLIILVSALMSLLLPLGDIERFASWDTAVRLLFLLGTAAVSAICLVGWRWPSAAADGADGVARAPIVSFMMAAVVVGLVVTTFVWQTRRLIWDIDGRGQQQSKYECVAAVRAVLEKPGPILASGGTCTDRTGRQVAYNAPEWFYWLDRKGFNVCDGEQSVDEVREYARRGAVYFVANDFNVGQKPGFIEDLESAFPVVYQGCETSVFDLP